MSTVVAAEAKLVVTLDTSKVDRDARARATTPATGPSPSRPTPAGDRPFDPVEHRENVAGRAWGGSLRARATELVASVPGAGTLLRSAELTRDLGPAGIEAARSAARELLRDNPAAQRAVDAALARQAESATYIASKLDAAEAFLDSVGETLEQLKELATGAAALNGVEPSEMAQHGVNIAKVNAFIASQRKVQLARGRAFQGGAIGNAAGAAVRSLLDARTFGRSGR